ncbi:MAG: DUF5519 family protein [Thermoflexus sp.]|jgi:phospholipase/carboxylesterase|uniref:luciferase domain-containing protein n=1 Tax=Thermoflexus TaxID=1495649 RepID=UPI001C79277D|nr:MULTISPECIES: luciferase family protein [Thermoflexus]MDT7883899.1 DUF5519 family protein [Thermoflexus sp.]MDT7948784.1 DUF5519 family protein [Thermoflexus sp.]QWK11968.1 MAG: hypothetical protein KNN16_06660 [Thermoflexus hugenholtzii]
MDRLEDLPARTGERPLTRRSMPHQQLTQNAPRALQEALFERAQALPGVRVAPSRISVPGARAFYLDPERARGPAEAFVFGYEFAHLHPPYDGSLHLSLPPELAERVVERGWGEFHPLVAQGVLPPIYVMVYGPRDEAELEVVWRILQASYAFACGEWMEPVQAQKGDRNK